MRAARSLLGSKRIKGCRGMIAVSKLDTHRDLILTSDNIHDGSDGRDISRYYRLALFAFVKHKGQHKSP
jgi:hypothetical protein